MWSRVFKRFSSSTGYISCQLLYSIEIKVQNIFIWCPTSSFFFRTTQHHSHQARFARFHQPRCADFESLRVASASAWVEDRSAQTTSRAIRIESNRIARIFAQVRFNILVHRFLNLFHAHACIICHGLHQSQKCRSRVGRARVATHSASSWCEIFARQHCPCWYAFLIFSTLESSTRLSFFKLIQITGPRVSPKQDASTSSLQMQSTTGTGYFVITPLQLADGYSIINYS